MAGPPIILTTDFGTADAYVGVMKGVILALDPTATIVDLTHQITPQSIRQAAFLLGTSYRFFPSGTIHVVVVDPGVGTDRRALLLVTPAARFLAPDNGVLSWVLRDHLGRPPAEPGRVPVPPGCSAYQLTNPEYWLHPVSATFHGRDIFAPVAAHLSLGLPPEKLGPGVDDLAWLPTPGLTRQGDAIQGQVIATDRFGNLITNIDAKALTGATRVLVEIKGHRITHLERTYYQEDDPEAGRLLALVGSHGFLEIAVRDGNAAVELRAGVGEPVSVIASGQPNHLFPL